MKVLVNVAHETFKPGEWVECEAVKFEEAGDGSFNIIVTTDVARMRKVDADQAALVERMRSQA